VTSFAFLVLIGMMFWYGVAPTFHLVFVPLFLLLAFLTSLGVGLWLSAINVKYRDVRYTVPFLVQIWMFATPIVYSVNIVPEKWRTLYALNPMVGVVEGFRWAILGSAAPAAVLAVSSLSALVMLLVGAFVFRRMEKFFADVV
jgi:lipopolysaccharide transport system permease protein